MMRPLFDIAPLRENIARGALILTSNNRLASKIRQAWGMAQQQSGSGSWPQPGVYALESWLDEQWLRCCDLGFAAATAGTPVTAELELLLWEQVIEEDSDKPATLLPGGFARQARNSYAMVQRWQIPDQHLQREAPLLWRWIDRFRAKLADHQLITAADRAILVRNAFLQGTLSPVKRIHLCGFDSLPPLYLCLLQAAANELAEQQLDGRGQHVRQIALFDEQQELERAADWAVARLQSNPEGRIGIVIPELPRLRARVERLLRSRLQPRYNRPEQPQSAPPFNLSAGISLADTPLVASALLLLTLNRPRLPLDDFCRMLNSPFWGEQSEVLRAQAEIRLRERAQRQPRCSEFRYQLARAEQPEDNPLSKRLEHFETQRREMPRSARYSQWLKLFRGQLDSLGWPGERGLDSIEYQQLQHWQELLEHYLHLDQLGVAVELSEALRQLQQLASSAVFQPETADAPIQVLGLLEGAGLRFDHLWITGMDDRRWPQPIAPNPLLPVALQREFGTPRSNPEYELQLATAQLTGYLGAAPEVILSYSQFDGDQPLQPSELIAGTAPISLSELPESSTDTTEFITLEQVACEYGPPLDLQRESIGGGTGIFKHQAGCPFNAFAIHRLGARQPPEPSLGLAPWERGNLLHDCLERLWRQLQNQQQLLALGDDPLQQLIEQTVADALRSWLKERPDLFGPAFVGIEQQRLAELLSRWLALEKTRPPFRVEALEKPLQTEFAGLPLRMTIDRIDGLEGDKRVIIDYKTGSASANRWLGERPEEPQLPLYLLCSGEAVAALSFAQVNASAQQFLGYAEHNGMLPGLRAPGGKAGEPGSWDELLEQWQRVLSGLAEEFKSGYAPVRFHSQSARQYQAELEPLNRAAELVANDESDEVDP